MKGVPFIPSGFTPPRRVSLAGLRLSVLGIDDLEPDYEAVMESGAGLYDLFHLGDRWPDGLTKRGNLIDLAWHEKEFARRTSFAWGLWRDDPDGAARYLGSAYVYPDAEARATAHAVHWIRSGEDAPALRVAFKTAWQDWVRAWPIASVRFSPE